jgi:hypothetical protein
MIKMKIRQLPHRRRHPPLPPSVQPVVQMLRAVVEHTQALVVLVVLVLLGKMVEMLVVWDLVW